jgi:hypothetical protein
VGVPQARCPPLDGDDAQSELQRLSVELFGELGDRHDPVGQPFVVELALDLDGRVASARALALLAITAAKEGEPGG